MTLRQVLALVSMSVAPIFGGFLAEFFSWRCSFFILAIVWSILGSYAWATMVESCPDVASEDQSYLKALSRIFAPDLLCLLLAIACLQSSWLVFSSNISYVAEVTYGQSTIATSFMMLAWAALCVLGLFRMRCHQVCQRLTAYQIARVQLLLVAAVAIISLVLSASFSRFLWAYLLASFLQSVVETSSIVPLAVLYFDPLADCTGVAVSIEILFKSVPPCIYCMVCTQSLVDAGIKSFMTLQSCTDAAAACVFLVYMVLWMTGATTQKLPMDQDTEPSCKG